MGYANPLQQYGLAEFIRDAQSSGADGLIVPDVPLEDYHSFWSVDTRGLDVILLTTPTSSEKRIREIDERSGGFVYCVSVTGTTGMRQSFATSVLDNVSRTYDVISKNKMLIGFGISAAEDIERFSPFCDGVIVGSAVIRHLNPENPQIPKAFDLVSELRIACNNPE